MLVFRCECETILSVAEDKGGALGECPNCGRVLHAPKTSLNLQGKLLCEAVVGGDAVVQTVTAVLAPDEDSEVVITAEDVEQAELAVEADEVSAEEVLAEVPNLESVAAITEELAPEEGGAEEVAVVEENASAHEAQETAAVETRAEEVEEEELVAEVTPAEVVAQEAPLAEETSEPETGAGEVEATEGEAETDAAARERRRLRKKQRLNKKKKRWKLKQQELAAGSSDPEAVAEELGATGTIAEMAEVAEHVEELPSGDEQATEDMGEVDEIVANAEKLAAAESAPAEESVAEESLAEAEDESAAAPAAQGRAGARSGKLGTRDRATNREVKDDAKSSVRRARSGAHGGTEAPSKSKLPLLIVAVLVLALGGAAADIFALGDHLGLGKLLGLTVEQKPDSENKDKDAAPAPAEETKSDVGEAKTEPTNTSADEAKTSDTAAKTE